MHGAILRGRDSLHPQRGHCTSRGAGFKEKTAIRACHRSVQYCTIVVFSTSRHIPPRASGMSTSCRKQPKTRSQRRFLKVTSQSLALFRPQITGRIPQCLCRFFSRKKVRSASQSLWSPNLPNRLRPARMVGLRREAILDTTIFCPGPPYNSLSKTLL